MSITVPNILKNIYIIDIVTITIVIIILNVSIWELLPDMGIAIFLFSTDTSQHSDHSFRNHNYLQTPIRFWSSDLGLK